MKTLRRTKFGNPILRQITRQLSSRQILSVETQTLIADMRHTLQTKKHGVGLAAPQIGSSLAICVIGIKPTPTRPKNKPFEAVMINPKIIETYGRRTALWEGCLSFGDPYAKALRYKKVRVSYQDEQARHHQLDFNGLQAHVVQHEIDHLNGILFVDHVSDNSSFITIQEYQKRYAKKPRKVRQS